MPRSWSVLLFLSLVLATGSPTPISALEQANCGSFALATAPQTPGQPLADNLVTLSGPSALVANGAFTQPLTVEPSPKSGIALVRSLGGIYGLMNVLTGAVTPLQIPDDDQRRLTSAHPTLQNAAEADFMLLAELPNAVWLVDLISGDALDLTTLGKESSTFIEAAAISPDGRWLIYFSQDEGFLISLESPGDPVPIAMEPMLPFPSFDDNNNVIYAIEGDMLVSIRSLDPATGIRTELATSANGRVLPFGLGPLLLLFDEKKLVKLQSSATTPTTIFEWVDGPTGVLSNESGTHLLVSDYRNDVTQWFWLEVASGSSVELSELDDMVPVTSAARPNAVLFAPAGRIGPGVPGAQYRTVNLTSGTVATPLLQDSSNVYHARSAGDTSGRYAIVNAVSPGSGRLWLIDNQEGKAVQVATSSGNADARVSPDGCQLAVAIYDTLGEGRTSTVTVTSLIDGSTVMTVPDALLLGWADVGSLT